MRGALLAQSVLLILAAGVLSPSRASARAMSIEAPPPPPLEIRFEGGALEERALEIRCRELDEQVACALRLEFDAVASPEGEGGELSLAGIDPEEASVDGSHLLRARIEPGQQAHVRLELTRILVRYTPPGSYLLMADGLWMRHLLLAPRSTRMNAGEGVLRGLSLSLFLSPHCTTRGPLRVRSEAPEGIEVSLDGRAVGESAEIELGAELSVAASARDEGGEILRHGGPYLAFGALRPGPEARFLMRAGYELGIHDWVVASVGVESDFESLFVASVTVELVTPAFFFFILGLPGASVGVGGALEVTDQGARGALRLSAGAQIFPAGFVGTFDYYPLGDEWVVTIAGRLSL